jgi:hypothetical protein
MAVVSWHRSDTCYGICHGIALARLKEQRESHKATKEIKIDTLDLSAISGELFQT